MLDNLSRGNRVLPFPLSLLSLFATSSHPDITRNTVPCCRAAKSSSERQLKTTHTQCRHECVKVARFHFFRLILLLFFFLLKTVRSCNLSFTVELLPSHWPARCSTQHSRWCRRQSKRPMSFQNDVRKYQCPPNGRLMMTKTAIK